MYSAEQIREHMPVIAADGAQIGTVDHLEGSNRIKLTKTDSPDGKHHIIPLEWIDHVDTHVHLSKNADEVRGEWTTMN